MEDFGVPIHSEMIEPFAAMLIGRLFARCEAAKKDRAVFEDACRSLWTTVGSLENIATSVRTAVHFSIAVSNHQRQISEYIKKELGIDPCEEWSNYA